VRERERELQVQSRSLLHLVIVLFLRFYNIIINNIIIISNHMIIIIIILVVAVAAHSLHVPLQHPSHCLSHSCCCCRCCCCCCCCCCRCCCCRCCCCSECSRVRSTRACFLLLFMLFSSSIYFLPCSLCFDFMHFVLLFIFLLDFVFCSRFPTLSLSLYLSLVLADNCSEARNLIRALVTSLRAFTLCCCCCCCCCSCWCCCNMLLTAACRMDNQLFSCIDFGSIYNCLTIDCCTVLLLCPIVQFMRHEI